MDLDPETHMTVLKLFEDIMKTTQAMQISVASMSATLDRMVVVSDQFRDACSGKFSSESPVELETIYSMDSCLISTSEETNMIEPLLDQNVDELIAETTISVEGSGSDPGEEGAVSHVTSEVHIVAEVLAGESCFSELLMQNDELPVANIVAANILKVPNIDEELQVKNVSSTCINYMAGSVPNIVREDAVETLEVSSTTVIHIQDNLESVEWRICSVDYNVNQEIGSNHGNGCEKDNVRINPLRAPLAFKGGTCNLLSKSTLGSTHQEEPTPKKGLGANSMIQVISDPELYQCTKEDKVVVSEYPTKCMVDTIKGLSTIYRTEFSTIDSYVGFCFDPGIGGKYTNIVVFELCDFMPQIQAISGSTNPSRVIVEGKHSLDIRWSGTLEEATVQSINPRDVSFHWGPGFKVSQLLLEHIDIFKIGAVTEIPHCRMSIQEIGVVTSYGKVPVISYTNQNVLKANIGDETIGKCTVYALIRTNTCGVRLERKWLFDSGMLYSLILDFLGGSAQLVLPLLKMPAFSKDIMCFHQPETLRFNGRVSITLQSRISTYMISMFSKQDPIFDPLLSFGCLHQIFTKSSTKCRMSSADIPNSFFGSENVFQLFYCPNSMRKYGYSVCLFVRDSRYVREDVWKFSWDDLVVTINYSKEVYLSFFMSTLYLSDISDGVGVEMTYLEVQLCSYMQRSAYALFLSIGDDINHIRGWPQCQDSQVNLDINQHSDGQLQLQSSTSCKRRFQ